MTRSVEIPEEGVLRGLYDDTRTLSIQGSVNHEVAIKLGDEEAFFAWATDLVAAVRTAAIVANVAALPYLVPEVVVDHRPGETCSVAAEVDPETGFARAPVAHNHSGRCCCLYAREADSYEPVSYCPACAEHAPAVPPVGDGGLREALEAQVGIWEGYTSDNPDVAAGFELAAGKLRELFAAHPAAPAVPLPVDREALIWAMCRADHKEPEGKSAEWLQYAEQTFGRYADAVLAVLAGEQEQARG